MKPILPLLLALALFISACGGGTATPTPASDIQSIPKTWIDAPLEGTTLPLGEIEITSHTTDLSGIARVELSVNNQIIRTDENPASSRSLFVLSQKWTPSQPGDYLVQVRGQNTGGTWSDYAGVNIKVIGATPTPVFTSTPTLTPTLTLTPTATLTATPLPTNTPTITPTSDNIIFQVPVPSGNKLYNVPGCGDPNQIIISILITTATRATLYYSIGGDGSFATEMLNPGGVQWTATISSDPSLGSYIGELQYYIRMENASTSADTPVYGGITVLNCKP